MPPCLLSNLLKVLSNLSPNIQNIGISSGCLAAWLARQFPQTGSDVTSLAKHHGIFFFQYLLIKTISPYVI